MRVHNKMSFIATLAAFLMAGSLMFGGQVPVYLGTAGNFVILSESGITCVPTSAITGNMGVSPIASAAITGFGLSKDSSGTFSTSSQVNGRVYAADYAPSTPSMLTMAVNSLITAYNDAAGRLNPDFNELGAGEIGGKTLAPGLYKWSTGISITKDVTLNGGPNDVWIFQSAGVLSMAPGARIILTGGAQAKNIFRQTISCTLNTTSHLEAITLATGTTVNGRLLAQTALTLQVNMVTTTIV